MTLPNAVPRRTVLKASGAATVVALAGCLSNPAGGASASTPEPDRHQSADHQNEDESFASKAHVEGLPSRPSESVTVEMTMVSESEPVFDREVVWVTPGGQVTWKNVDEEAHTATAYSPQNDKPQRLPAGGGSWDSGMLQTGETYTQTFETPGIYDYYCIPHEALGMVGTVVVGQPTPDGQPGLEPAQDSLPGKAPAGINALNRRVESLLQA